MKLNYRFFIFLSFFLITLFFLIFKIIDVSLKKYTRHYEIIQVPSLLGLSLSSVEDTLKKINLEFVVLDSAAYNPNYNRGAILSHTPKEGSNVKPERKIYLTINPLTIQYIPLPDLKDKSLRQAMSLLESNAFRVGNLYYVDYFAKDVIRFVKATGNIINKGDSLPKFTIIDMYLGNGQMKTIEVPDIIGLEFQNIKSKLNNYSLNLGEYYFNQIIDDTAAAIIYKQHPIYGEKVPLGSYVSIWLKDSLN